MRQDNVIYGLLEGLAAEALSTPVDDSESIGRFGLHLRHALVEETPKAVCEALQFGVSAVSRIRSGSESNVAGIMEDIAGRLVEAAEQLNTTGQQAHQATQAGDPRSADVTVRGGSFQLTDSDDIDAELLKEFSIECAEHIDNAEASLLSLEAQGENGQAVDTILRAFHTIKGAAGFMCVEPIQTLSHLAENLLTEARDGGIVLTGRYADLVFRTCDMLKDMSGALDGAVPGQVIPLPLGLCELIDDLSVSADSVEPCAATSISQPLTIEEPQITGDSEPASVEESPKTETPRQAPGPVSDESVRVTIDRLDSLVNMVGELVIAHSMISQDPAVVGGNQERLGRSVRQAGKIVRELQELATAMRMVPLRSTFQKVSRAVRELARSEGKNVQLATVGEDTEIDRHMVEALTDPLIHMIRNAIDHGIESPDDRTRAGKAANGTIHLSACHSAGRVQIELRDDGRGLNREQIIAKAVESGLVEPDAQPPDSELFALIFEPGFTTAGCVTEVSGRGVGMDVVNRNIASLHGRVEVASEPGQGAIFTISLPLTLAITDVMAVRVGPEEYLLPMIAIERAFRPTPESVSSTAGSDELVMYRDEILPLFRLHRLLGVDGAIVNPSEALAIVISGRGKRCALMVDDLLGHRQAVIKSLGKALQGSKETAGGAILGDGRVGLILDPDSIVALAMEQAGHTNTRAA